MMRATSLIVFVILQVACEWRKVEARCRVELLMQSYSNSREHDYGGSCCDPFCAGQCDHLFTFCLDTESQDMDTTKCAYFAYNTGEFKNQNVINFGNYMKGVSNPMTYEFRRCPGGARFKVRVRDDDSGHSGHDLVDLLYYSIRLTPAKTESVARWSPKTLSGIRSRDKTTLRMVSRIYCLPNYFGPTCNTHCMAKDSASGHYWCDPDNGRIVCRPGWEDPITKCTTYSDDCAGVVCQNGGTCIDGQRTFTCNCASGYKGVHCEVDVDECASSPCQNEGSCTEAVDSFSCDCPPGYVGDLCQGHVCADESTCLNNATCYGSGNCLCLPGFTGNDCGVNFCDFRECKNYGSCVRDTGICDCPDGFIGDSCGVSLCSLVDCENSGTCIHGRCLCPAGFTGRYCHNQINECVSNPCDNDALCFDQVNSFECKCMPGFNGVNCEEELVKNGSYNPYEPSVDALLSNDVQGPFPVWGLALVVVVLVLVVIIGVVVTVMWRFKRKARKAQMEADFTNGDFGSFNNPVYSSTVSDAANSTSVLTRPANGVANEYVIGATASSNEPDVEPKCSNVYDDIDVLMSTPVQDKDKSHPTQEKSPVSEDNIYLEPTSLESPNPPDSCMDHYETLGCEVNLKGPALPQRPVTEA